MSDKYIEIRRDVEIHPGDLEPKYSNPRPIDLANALEAVVATSRAPAEPRRADALADACEAYAFVVRNRVHSLAEGGCCDGPVCRAAMAAALRAR